MMFGYRLVLIALMMTMTMNTSFALMSKAPFIQSIIHGKDGSYGWSYLTVDGKTHYETKDQNGVVRGRYTYYDPTGHKVAVNYIADNNGFRVLGGFQPGPVDDTPKIVQSGNSFAVL